MANDTPTDEFADFTFPDKDLLSYVLDDAPCEDNKIIYIDADDETKTLDYGTVRTTIKRLGQGLYEAGVRQDDIVLVFSPNQIMYPCVILGIVCAGGVFTGANPSYTKHELAHQISHSRAKLLVVDNALLRVALEAAELAGFDRDCIYSFLESSHAKPLQSLISTTQEREWKRITRVEELKETTAIVLYSSGTTGLPKGVELSHRNVVANTCQTIYMRTKGDQILETKGEDPLDGAPSIGHLPMYHAYGLMQACNYALRSGTTFIVTRKFELRQMLGIIQRHGVKILNTVPPVITLLAKDPTVLAFDVSSLRSVGSGAAPLGQEVQDALRARLDPRARFQQGWGMSELTCTGLSMYTSDDDRTGSCGHLIPGTEARLIDASGNIIPLSFLSSSPPAEGESDEDGKEGGQGGRGELLIRGPQVMKGYLRDRPATEATFRDGDWLSTGDIARRSHDGRWFWIVDRKKELIKSRGLQVAPAELEALLLSHPLIADACVVGVPWDGDEAPRAYLVRSQLGPVITAEEIHRWFDERVAGFKRLRGGIRFLDVIPKSLSGKLLRRELRELAKAEVSPLRSKL